MKNLLFLALLLAAPHPVEGAAIKGLYRKHISKPDQPRCDPGYEYVVPSGSIMLTGDGDGMDKNHEVVAGLLKACPDCRVRLDTGDVYTWGVNSKSEYEDKVAAVDKLTEHIPGFKHYRALGNHSYYGDPQLQVELQGYCYQYAVTDNLTWKAVVIDTNKPSLPQLDRALHYLCEPPIRDLQIVVGHHPAYSNSEEERSSEEAATREWLKPLSASGCVDLFVTGHDHHLEVIDTRMIDKLGKDWGAYFGFVSGGGGRALRDVKRGVSGQVAIHKSFGGGVIRGRTLYLYNESGLLLGEPIEIPRVR
jgi:hypothetical protein